MRTDTSDIYEDLQRKLMTAAFRPGEKLKPAALQGAYGCSPNTVREVLMQLSKVGLVEFELQRGFRVRHTSAERRADVTKFRILLEQEGAALSMQHGGIKWESEMSAAHHKLSHIEKQLERDRVIDSLMDLWSDAELDFHKTLISRCRSDLLRETYASVYAQFRQQMVSLERDFGTDYFGAIISEHQAILDAALDRDVERCQSAIYDHLKRNLTV